jgi:hypothetical protein
MQDRRYLGIAALALLATLSPPATAAETHNSATPGGAARPQGESHQRLDLSSAQQQQLAHALAEERAQLPPAGFKPSVGGTVPSSVSLVPVPLMVSNEIPATKNFSFAKLQDQKILLVDPKNREIAEVIQAPASTTGRGSP